MLGEKIGEATGAVTSRRVVTPTKGPSVEVSFQQQGTLLGVKCQEFGTYLAVRRPDGTLKGSGRGIGMGPNGEAVTWHGEGLGTIDKDGAIHFRGALYFESDSKGWTRLNGIVGVFEHDVDKDGNVKSVVTEWH